MTEYMFNVASDGRHFFRTDWVNDAGRAAEMRRQLVAKFPGREGYTVTQHERTTRLTTREVTE
jgi:hypothetical protein